MGLWAESATLRTRSALGPLGLSSDSGLGGSSDGSSDILAFGAGSVVDSVTEEGGYLPPHFHRSPSLALPPPLPG